MQGSHVNLTRRGDELNERLRNGSRDLEDRTKEEKEQWLSSQASMLVLHFEGELLYAWYGFLDLVVFL